MTFCYKSRYIKTAVLAVLFIIIGLMPMTANPVDKKRVSKVSQPMTMANLDFAYPKTVEQVARKSFESGLKSNNDVEILRSLIALTVAENMINTENVCRQISLMDSVAAIVKPQFKSLTYLLEASLYNDIYNREYRNNGRLSSPSIAQQDPRFWDRELFRTKINELVTRALDLSEPTKSMSLESVSPIIKIDSNPDFPLSYSDLSVYDFIVQKSVELLQNFRKPAVIPFYPEKSDSTLSPLRLVESDIAHHSSPSLGLSLAIYSKSLLLPEDQQKAFLYSEIDKLRDTEYCVPLVAYYYSRFVSRQDLPEEGTKEFYILVEGLSEKFSKTMFVKPLNIIKDLMRIETVSVSTPHALISRVPFLANIEASNINFFYILIYKAKSSEERNVKISGLDYGYKQVNCIPVNLAGNIPFNSTDSISLQINEPGKYYLVVSKTKKASGSICKSSDSPNVFLVTDFDLIAFTDSNSDTIGCYVVDAATSLPLQGVSVTFKEQVRYYDRDKAKKASVITDQNGFAMSPFKTSTAEVTLGGISNSIYLSPYASPSGSDKLRAGILTDLGVYHPGDSVRFCGILYSASDKNKALAKDSVVNVKLLDANYQEVDRIQLKSDESGRIFGSFLIPKEGLLGNWSLQVADNERIGSVSVRVEEYKIPSFFMTLEKNETKADQIEFEGFARTYSGMPLSDITVDFTVDYTDRWLWRYNSTPQNYSGETRTDADGRFKILLPTGNLPETYRTGIFTIRALATDQAGESIESPSRSFFLKETLTIIPSFPDKMEITGDSIELSVIVRDQVDLPVKREVDYIISNERGDEIAKGRFLSPALQIDSKELRSGKYIFKFRLSENETESEWTSKSLVIFRPTDTVPPIQTGLWIPSDKYIVSNEEQTVKVVYGSSSNGKGILCVISDSHGNVERKWLVSDGMNHTIELLKPTDSQRKYVEFITFADHVCQRQTVTIIPSAQLNKLEIETVSFRDAVSVDDKEKWSFRLKNGNLSPQGYGVAVMYDKALDAISPLNWSLPNYNPVYRKGFDISAYSTWGFNISYSSPSKWYYFGNPFNPLTFNTWGYPLYPALQVLYRNAMATMKSSSAKYEVMEESAVMADSADMEVAQEMPKTYASGGFNDDVEVTAEEGDMSQGSAESSNEEEFRMAEMPLAFFRAELSSDAQGNISVDFTVPNFNTTWKFMLGAYTSEIESAVTVLETVASKKVMTKLLYPRFIRTGDKITLKATLYNNSETTLPIEGRIEIFNPVTNTILATEEFPATEVDPSGNRVISLDFNCPSDINVIGIRALGSAYGNTDGEQTIIPVLPSSQPVVESTTFYASPGQNTINLPLPEYPSDATLTFTYTDNTAWEALTALSPMTFPYSESLIPLLHALYANSVGYGLLKKYPRLHEGLKMIVDGQAGDSILVSNLEKNINLKTVLLNNTPWVNDARSETLKMSRLNSLLDDSLADKTIVNCWDKIMALRNPDGGWSWFNGCESSRWITENVLDILGKIKEAGYNLPLPDFNQAVKEGINFCERNILYHYSNTKNKKDYPYTSLLNYFRIRNRFPEISLASAMAPLKKKMLDALENNWHTYSPYDKATIAMLLYQEGRKSSAIKIMESVMQFASFTQDKGMWFDRTGSSAGNETELATGVRILSALNLMDPEDDNIDKIRQWILLQRQTQNWQNDISYIETINALLTIGKDWGQNYGKPLITIGGKLIEQDKISELTGSCTITLNTATTSGGELVIKRDSDTPAWGGVVCQYIMPMKEVIAADIPDLKIEKQIWKIESGLKGETKVIASDDFNLGDKIRVALLVTCEKDMDFVAITDERSACLEPLDKISGNTSIDGVWCYREIRNSALNIFIPVLNKGKYVFYYEGTVQESGEFSSGIATVQCLYAPVLMAHSKGSLIKVK